MDPDVLFCIEINLEFLFASHNGNEMVDILLVGVFDAKVVHNKCERDVAKFVYEHTISVFSLDIIMFVEVFDQVIVGDLPCLL